MKWWYILYLSLFAMHLTHILLLQLVVPDRFPRTLFDKWRGATVLHSFPVNVDLRAHQNNYISTSWTCGCICDVACTSSSWNAAFSPAAFWSVEATYGGESKRERVISLPVLWCRPGAPCMIIEQWRSTVRAALPLFCISTSLISHTLYINLYTKQFHHAFFCNMLLH